MKISYSNDKRLIQIKQYTIRNIYQFSDHDPTSQRVIAGQRVLLDRIRKKHMKMQARTNV